MINKQVTYKPEDLLDIKKVRDLLNKLINVCFFYSSVVDNKGEIIISNLNRNLCEKFNNKNNNCLKKCVLDKNENKIEKNKILKGTLGIYGDIEKEIIWRKEYINVLKFIENLIINALEGLKVKKLAEENEMKFTELFKISPNALSLSSLNDGKVIEINNSFTEIFGFTRKDIIGKTSENLNSWINLDERNKSFALLKNENHIKNIEFHFRTKNDDIIDVAISSSIINIKDEKIIFSAFTDISSIKRAEKELIYAKEKAEENNIPLYLSKDLNDEESKIITDELKLNKILSNLLKNAFKFTLSGFIEFGYKYLNNKIEIYVKDTGIGIKPEKQKMIFDRFSQEEAEMSGKAGGLGLGLSIAKENTELLNGELKLKSEKGSGSDFSVSIPYKPANKEGVNKSKTERK